MIEIDIPKSVVEKLQARADEIGALKNSIEKGRGNIVGLLGEWLFQQFRPEADHVDEYDFDFVSKGKRIEVKTKKINSKPNSDFHCNVSHFNTRQNADIYIFAAVLSDFSKGYLYGWEYKAEFFKKAKFYSDGATYESGPLKDRFFFRGDSWNLCIKELRPLG